MVRGVLVLALAVVIQFPGSGVTAHSRNGTVDVYKSATCGCCNQWVEHLRRHGFTVRTTNSEQVAELKHRHGVPGRLYSCHTALVGGYVIEGHVPAADVQRLLETRPAVVGLAVPGMPIGSPGMETPGQRMHPFQVLAFGKDGQTRVFATYGL